MNDEATTFPSSPVVIVPYAPRYQHDFRRLNEAWITEHFVLEQADHQVLEHPEESILAPGGEILFAVVENTVVGTCALVKIEDGRFDYELAKMAVDPSYRRHGIGQQLAEAVIEQARKLGAKTVFLESNTVLEPAVLLYRKLGFVETSRQPSPYSRGNIHMVLQLTDPPTVDPIGAQTRI